MTPIETELLALLPGAVPTQAAVRQRLEAAGMGAVQEVMDADAPGWTLAASPEEGWTLAVAEVPALHRLHVTTGGLSAEELTKTSAACGALAVRGALRSGRALEAFERLLRVLAVAAPDAVGVFDPDAASLRSGAWLQEVTVEGVPLRLDALYRIHAVVAGVDTGNEDGTADGDAPPGDPEANAPAEDDLSHEIIWMHTHGLRRCGLREIELHGVRDATLQAAGALLQAIAHRALAQGLPDLGEAVSYGRDLDVALVPWRFAWPDLAGTVDVDAAPPPVEEVSVGGRDDRDAQHTEDNLVAVLWQPTGPHAGRWRSAVEALEAMGEHPVFFLTEYETDRLEALARLRWSSFSALAHHLAPLEDWRFLAKFSYGGEPAGAGDRGVGSGDGGASHAPPDGHANGPLSREHLWFQVHDADALSADATLINEPWQPLGLKVGDRGRHPIERLTDFRISGPLGSASPDTVDRLLRRWIRSIGSSDAH